MSKIKNNRSKNYEALVEYIKENQNSFYRLAYSYVKDKDEALDIVQESIYKGLKSIDSLKDIEFMKTWFYRIVINTALNSVKSSKKIVDIEDIAELKEDDTTSKLGENIDLYEAIDMLSDNYKTVVVMRYFEDMKIDEIAKVTSTNTNTVKTRLYTALGKLKDLLESEVKYG